MRLTLLLLLMPWGIQSRAQANPAVNCFKALGLHASDTALVNIIVSARFCYYYPQPARSRVSFTPTSDTVAALMARYPEIEFRSTTMHTNDGLKIGYDLTMAKGTVKHMMCFDTNVVRQYMSYLGFAPTFDEEFARKRPGYAVVWRSQGQSAEIWYMRSDSFIIKARYDVRGMPTTVFIYGTGNVSYYNELRELNKKLAAMAQPAATTSKPSTPTNTGLPIIVLSTAQELLLVKKDIKDLFIQMDNMMKKANVQVSHGKSSSDFHYIENAVLELGMPLLKTEKRVNGINDSKVANEMKEVKRLIALFRADIPKLAVSSGLAAKAREHTEWYVKNVEDAEKILDDMRKCLIKMDDQVNAAGKKSLR